MARVSGPLMSLDASGKFADTLVASIWKGRNYMRKYVIPANPKTAAQTAHRGTFSDAVAGWHNLPETDDDITSDTLQTSTEAWNQAAGDCSPPISGFNYFVSSWIKQSAESDFVAADGPSIPAVPISKSDSLHG